MSSSHAAAIDEMTPKAAAEAVDSFIARVELSISTNEGASEGEPPPAPAVLPPNRGCCRACLLKIMRR